MRRFLLGLVLGALVAGCGSTVANDKATDATVEFSFYMEPAKVSIVHLRGCDYVVGIFNHGIAITHAADCPNPIHSAH